MHSKQNGRESISNPGAINWNLVAVHMKDLKSLSTFKNQIKKWIPKDCLRRLCKVYVAQCMYVCMYVCIYLFMYLFIYSLFQ